eukprot:GGOE01011075.1.p1 GENE.GGOE01011075.1~~GGOE01011075.1.p1  ORF type:complete len:135 (+),score=0.99 GGOE01011075.1:1400-1804(+)
MLQTGCGVCEKYGWSSWVGTMCYMRCVSVCANMGGGVDGESKKEEQQDVRPCCDVAQELAVNREHIYKKMLPWNQYNWCSRRLTVMANQCFWDGTYREARSRLEGVSDRGWGEYVRPFHPGEELFTKRMGCEGC